MNHPPSTLTSRATLWAGLLGRCILLAGCSQPTTTSVVQPPSEIVNLESRPTNLKTTLFQGISLPVADQGPHSASGAVASGFDRNPIGASLAAVQTTVRMSVATDSQWVLVGQQMLAPGLGRDAWATARSQISITDPIAVNAPKIAGYRVVNYTPDHAEIAIYTIESDHSITRNTATVVWQIGDWKLLLPTQPQSSPVTTVAELPTNLIALPLQ
ncbi:hypothetical protein [Nocardia sp. NPDC059228]|uniref:hypothetical protein n=1 Tax=Nocardia sp. NPDC059228 TaxID=3346777 RepID=UPI0036C60AAB